MVWPYEKPFQRCIQKESSDWKKKRRSKRRKAFQKTYGRIEISEDWEYGRCISKKRIRRRRRSRTRWRYFIIVSKKYFKKSIRCTPKWPIYVDIEQPLLDIAIFTREPLYGLLLRFIFGKFSLFVIKFREMCTSFPHMKFSEKYVLLSKLFTFVIIYLV